MADIVNTGAAANDGSGDQLRTAFQQINQRFQQLQGTLSQITWAPGLAIEATPARQWTVVAGQAYAATTNHTAGATFAADLAAGRWVALDVMQVVDDLATPGAGKGAEMVAFDGGTVQDVLDDAKPMQSYTALRAYTGRATGVRITSSGIAGFFWRDASDTTSTDNGGTVIVDASGRRWKRLYSGDVHVSWFGANGAANAAPAINAADTAASLAGVGVRFDGVEYTIKARIVISTPWIGVPGKTAIRVPTDMVYDAGLPDPIRYSALTNKGCSTVYNALTADWLALSGIKFIDSSGSAGLVNAAFANVYGGEIADCNWTTEKTGAVTLLDLHACVKNVTVQRVRISNLTQNSVGGGCMWVRNITANGALAANDTENIRVIDSYFEQTSLDEAFAVYGVNGMTKNVRVSRCTFNGTLASEQRHGNLVTAFPLGNTASAGVQDVVFSECRFESSNFINHVLRIGQTADASRVCKDIVVRDSYFKARLPTAATSAVARNIPCVGGNIKFLNNTVEADGSTQQITYGVQRFDVVGENCVVSGNVANAYAECQILDDCASKSITGAATLNCLRVTNCNLQAATNGIVGNTTARYELLNNKIELTATSGSFNAVFLNSVASSEPVGEILVNQIVLNNASAYAVRVAGSGMANTRVVNNRAEGTGKTIVGTQLKEVSGNNWFGTLDSVRASAYVDYDHNYATPIGTFAVAATHTAGTSRRLLGWVKVANAGNSSDWVTQFAEIANN